MINLDNKVALIPGGATMIGKKIAHEFISAGAKVTVCDIDTDGGHELQQEAGAVLKFIHADITDDTQIDSVIEQTIEHGGGIDFLVNVACTYLDNGIDSTRAEWLEALNVNLVSGAVFVQKSAPYMRRRGGGAVVNLSSISGKQAQPGRLLYAASKAAVIGATRNQALLLAEDNIRVNSVSPGWVWSNVIRDMTGNDRAKADRIAGEFHLSGRAVDPEEVARTVVFLCSDAASGINGTDVPVDSGYSAIGAEQKTDKVAQLSETSG